MATLRFYGATREVTGSMHLVNIHDEWIALDCGLFQGRRSDTAHKNLDFPIAPERLRAVVLSHAHIDHSGRLPLLVKKGFSGSIYATPATRDLCAIMLADAAHIQEEDAVYLNKKRARRGEPPIEPLYDQRDAISAVRQFQSVSYGRPFQVNGVVQARFFDAGHMLGSAGIELVISNGTAQPIRLVFSGDLGRFGQPILRDPVPLPDYDYLICESTYGGRTTPPTSDLTGQLAEVIERTFARGGKVIIPAFSVGRTQTVVYGIHQLVRQGRNIPVFVDSPLAVNATEVFRMHPECYDSDALELQQSIGDFLGASYCRYVRSVEESKALHRRRMPCVIISASGMCETGRILHHLKNNIAQPRNTILIVGFQGANTLGRRLVEREPMVSIFGKRYHVRAEIVVLNGFSSHADRNELRRLVSPQAPSCRQAFLVHGEEDQMIKMADMMRSDGYRNVALPESGQLFDLV